MRLKNRFLINLSFHVNLEKWEKLLDPSNCPICNDLPPPKDNIDIYELDYTWLDAEPIDCIRGACHVISKIHTIELYDLNDDELLGFMKEVSLYAKALKSVTNAVKINYEIHGNSLPHLHLHLYPRYKNDPFPNQPINYHIKLDLYEPGKFQEFVNNMRAEIENQLI